MIRWLMLVTSLLLVSCSDHAGVALGTLERDRIAHTATMNEVVVELPVAQGSYVEKGTVLVRLDDRQQRSQVERARSTVAQAEANLEKLRNGAREEEVAAGQARVAGAKATLTESKQNYLRVKQLAAKNMASQSDIDHSRANRDAASANLRTAQEQLRELTNGTREEDLRMAEAELNAAKAQLESEQKHLSDLTIIATREGLLDNLPWNLGERVTAGSPLAIVLAGKAPYARVYIPEPYRVKIKVGDHLQVKVDGIEKSITGTVRRLSTEPAFTPYYALNQGERGRLMYLAEIQLPDSAEELPNGIPAQVVMP